MIIFLFGPDTYRSSRKLKEIVNRYKEIHQSGLNLKYLNCRNISFRDFESSSNQASMFKERKLLVLVNIFSCPEFKKQFIAKGESFKNSKDVFVIYEEGKISKRDALVSFLKKNAQVQEFLPMTKSALKKWVREETERLDRHISEEAVSAMVDFVQEDLWRMTNELMKLNNFVKDKGEITREDVELMVKPKIETDIFKTIDAIASRNKAGALKFIREHLEKGDSPLYLLSMIGFQFRNLLIVKDLIEKGLSPFSSSGLHPFVVKKSLAICKKFNMDELKKIYQNIFQVDLYVKTGRVEAETALDLLISKI